MGFVTPLLLAGAALVAVPIVLHLVMRREAKRIVFPALRFVQQRRNVNQHRLQLRHLLLLALRCALIALLAFALARPTLRGSGATGKEDAPLAAAFVFDNSLRMQYEHENKSRLEHAKELADLMLRQVPASTPITIIDRSGRQRGKDLDRSAVELRVERTDVSAEVRSMGEAIQDAARWLEEKPDHRGEIFVFTDMSAEAWSETTINDLKAQLAAMPGLNVYLIDVGVERPRDVGLTALRLSNERMSPGGILRLDTEVVKLGELAAGGGEGVAELFVNDASGKPEKRGEQTVTLDGDKPEAAEFSLAGLGLGVHQGMVRIVTGDALPADDVRYFTVDVRPPTKVLLLAQRDEDALFLREALAPSAAVGHVQAKFECEVATFAGLASRPLADYAAVCVIDPPPLDDASWKTLVDFADHGGGVGVFLGRSAKSASMNSDQAQQLLPAKLRWQSREPTYLRPVAVEHPAMGELRDLADVPWAEFPVFTYWELGEGAAGSNVIASYANGKPALAERQLGGGRVLMLTTSVSDPAHDDPWNLLPTGSDPWPFLALMNGVVDYLAASGETQLNYLAGQTVVLPIAADEEVSNFVLQMPDGSALRQPVTPGQRDVSIASTEMLGNYRLLGGGPEKLERGFSVNLPADVTRLERVSGEELVRSVGEDRLRIARTPEEIEMRVGAARTGQELFPALILLFAFILAAESVLANRFYAGAGDGGAQKDFGSRMADFGLTTNGSRSAAPSSPPEVVGAGASEARK